MKAKLFKGKFRNPGDGQEVEREKIIDVEFTIHKFNSRPKPKDTKRVMIISCFSEFGCETVGVMYCIPAILRQFPGYYTIVMGWYGRDYLYRHLVDEFWEIKEEYQWLRDYCRAFHHESRNLKKIEQSVQEYGKVIPTTQVGQICVTSSCRQCKHRWGHEKPAKCPHCGSTNIFRPIFSDIQTAKQYVTMIPKPSRQTMENAQQYLKDKSVGVFARGRTTYGRNLQPEFYVKLVGLLEEMGYNPIWLGEKQSTQPCPVDHIVDFSRMAEAQDLELTLAILSQLEFTVQFWTASTRLSSMMGIPYLLFESPDQIFGNGQEGYRRNLCDFGSSKLCISHFLNVFEDHENALGLVRECISEMNEGNYEDKFGLLETEIAARTMKQDNLERIGGK